MKIHSQKFKPVSEINMTPFIDVVLVLLIVFMITAPLMTVGIEVDLPDTKASALNEPIEPMVVSVNQAGQIYVKETPVDADALVPTIKAMIQGNKDEPVIYVQMDKTQTMSMLMNVMGRLNQAGFKKLSVVGASGGGSSTPNKKNKNRRPL
jgi:biopolymer transport protein TolR